MMLSPQCLVDAWDISLAHSSTLGCWVPLHEIWAQLLIHIENMEVRIGKGWRQIDANNVPSISTPALTVFESFLGMESPWISHIEAEWLCMVDYEILLGDAQSSGDVGWGFATHNKVFGIIDHVLTLARCAEIPSADLWNASNISRYSFEKNWQQEKTWQDYFPVLDFVCECFAWATWQRRSKPHGQRPKAVPVNKPCLRPFVCLRLRNSDQHQNFQLPAPIGPILMRRCCNHVKNRWFYPWHVLGKSLADINISMTSDSKPRQITTC